ncbi:MAG: arginine N-succinyltransferase [Phycisphaerae bacterium]|nr:arginine N-succinyltransferase [Phycisphaerae bacterium]
MFLVRQAHSDDLPTLLKLAKMVHFINLPADKDIIAAKIGRSRKSFSGQAKDPHERQFMFVLEDSESGAVIGTSAIMSCISWPGWPHVFLQVRRRSYFSEDLQHGSVHTTVQFATDESGPSEVGGLILAPGYRGHRERLGSLLSLIRLHFVGLHRAEFADRMLAELMGPVTPDSQTLLWEYLGRRFINLSYDEADLFCQHSKEFMTSLWPRDEMHASVLPAEARALIGKVGEETVAAKAMLERQGFTFNGQVDPFDGGPYLEAKTDEIPLVRATRAMKLAGAIDDAGAGGAKGSDGAKRGDGAKGASRAESASTGFVSFRSKEHGFRAVRSRIGIDGEGVRLPESVIDLLGARKGIEIGVTPLDAPSEAKGRSRRAGQRSSLSALADLPGDAGSAAA